MDATTIHLIAIGVNILGFGLTGIMFCVIKFNDLKHIDEDVRSLIKKVGELAERVSKVEGTLQKK